MVADHVTFLGYAVGATTQATDPGLRIIFWSAVIAACSALALGFYKAARAVQLGLNWADRIEKAVERVEAQTNGAMQSQFTEINDSLHQIQKRIAVIEATYGKLTQS